jgi:hypothetical protein
MRNMIAVAAIGFAFATLLAFGPPKLTNSTAHAQSCGPKHQACLERCKDTRGRRGAGRCASVCADKFCKK